TKNFHLTIKYLMKNIPYMDTWIKFAIFLISSTTVSVSSNSTLRL
ncbi:unnamed protein product, partial [Brassica rapa subsp. narinosa]